MTSEAPPRGPGYAKGRATREEILDAATRLFGEVGYHTASLREVASRVGISHPGLMHHFPTKADLLAAVLQRRDEVDGAALEAESADGADYVTALARLAERNATKPTIVELFASLSAEATTPEHPAHDWFATRYAGLLDRVTTDLEQVRADGRLRADVDPRTAARLIVAAMDGLQVQFLYEDGRVDMAAAITALYRSFLVA
ncbi:TetR/AcrR family transcriptional regulator [Cellulomonas sp. HZM]|uniref:TetR/AcrR family transcriptional regulator n=1 Tax=Cellulomonas sp. HZM TaxID=1454010 RepID=UPI000493B0F8|nr:TetR/AcrR family transcriptional regulator [Cellulomonas sp. HZM]